MKKLCAVIISVLAVSAAVALGADASSEAPPQASPAPGRPYEKPAFWGTFLINLPTTTTPDRGDFLLRISHRFEQPMDSGFDDLLGLDGYANVLVSLGYAVTDKLAFSIGRARLYKEFEFGADWLLAEQGVRGRIPVSVALHGGFSLATQGEDNAKFSAALSVSRQFGRRFSLLAVPVFVTNADHWDIDSQATLALGLGARYMVFEDLSVLVEWVPSLAGYAAGENGWGVGIEKKIGGHVFQVFVANSLGLTTAQYAPGGDLRFRPFDFRIGFNIFRKF